MASDDHEIPQNGGEKGGFDVVGFRGVAAFAVGDVAGGEEQFIQMFVVALTIAAGLLVGNTIIRPKATL